MANQILDFSEKSIHASKTRLYRIYCGIKQRCLNPNNPRYSHYGGRGISICSEWIDKNGLNNFISWSLNHGYDDTLTIDRIDNNKGYSPDNCQWVTASYNSSKGTSDIKNIKCLATPNQKELIKNRFNTGKSLTLDLKSIIIKSGWTLSRVNDELNKRHGTSLGFQNFSNRLRGETFKYTEVLEILDIIGYDIQWIKRDS